MIEIFRVVGAPLDLVLQFVGGRSCLTTRPAQTPRNRDQRKSSLGFSQQTVVNMLVVVMAHLRVPLSSLDCIIVFASLGAEMKLVIRGSELKLWRN